MHKISEIQHVDEGSEIDFTPFRTERRAHSVGEQEELVTQPELRAFIEVGDANGVPLPGDKTKTPEVCLFFHLTHTTGIVGKVEPQIESDHHQNLRREVRGLHCLRDGYLEGQGPVTS